MPFVVTATTSDRVAASTTAAPAPKAVLEFGGVSCDPRKADVNALDMLAVLVACALPLPVVAVEVPVAVPVPVVSDFDVAIALPPFPLL